MSYSITPTSRTVSEGVGTITFTVARTSATIAETVYFSTVQNQGYTNSGDYSGLLDAPLSFGVGVFSRTITLNILNDSLVEGTETFGVLLDMAGGAVLASGTFTITDNDTAASTFALTPVNQTVSEGASSITFTVTRSSGSGSETVYFSTIQNQGSTNSGDYTGRDTVAVNFANGVTTQTITVNITNDSLAEGTETFGAIIENSGGTVLDSSTFTITDNDSAASTFSLTPVNRTVSEDAGSITFTVTRSSGSGSETVYFSTVQDQGSNNSGDYTGRDTVAVNFANGVTTQTITVNIINDALLESTETFGAIIENAAGTVLDSSTFTITDNDSAASTFTLTPVNQTVAEGVGSITFTISRSSSAGAETVYFSTIPNQGSANNGDYSGRDTVAVNFAAGVATQTITVNITNDSIAEGTETFGAIIENVGGTVLDTSTFTITDNDGGASPTNWTKPIGFSFLPVSGSPRVNQGFGGDTSHNVQPYSIDFSAVSGTNVRAMADGVVIGIRSGSTGIDLGQGGFGNYVTIRHTGGVIATYAHLSVISVTLNQTVTAGVTKLGESGSSGGYDPAGSAPPTSYAPHLHITLGDTTTGPGTQLTDGTYAPGSMVRANGSSAPGSPAFFLSHFSSISETGGVLNPATAALQQTDIFGTSQAMRANGTPWPDSDQDDLAGRGSANNRIFAGSGNDRLDGGNGNDILVGGSGNDRVTGGAGADDFVLSRSGVDRIVDFNSADDTIKLDNGAFSELGGVGTIATGVLRLGAEATLETHRLIYSGGQLFFDPDGSGSTGKILIATLDNSPSLTRFDFVVI